MSLKRVLDFVTRAAGYQYEVQPDAVVVRPGDGQAEMETQFFAVSRPTVRRMTGRTEGSSLRRSFRIPHAQRVLSTVLRCAMHQPWHSLQ
jgi:hypothetical protein